MFQIFLFEGYSRKKSNYMKRIILFDLTHMIIMINPMAINVETPMRNSECSLDKEFITLMYMNP